jgi:hypothetical protein
MLVRVEPLTAAEQAELRQASEAVAKAQANLNAVEQKVKAAHGDNRHQYSYNWNSDNSTNVVDIQDSFALIWKVVNNWIYSGSE